MVRKRSVRRELVGQLKGTGDVYQEEVQEGRWVARVQYQLDETRGVVEFKSLDGTTHVTKNKATRTIGQVLVVSGEHDLVIGVKPPLRLRLDDGQELGLVITSGDPVAGVYQVKCSRNAE